MPLNRYDARAYYKVDSDIFIMLQSLYLISTDARVQWSKCFTDVYTHLLPWPELTALEFPLTFHFLSVSILRLHAGNRGGVVQRVPWAYQTGQKRAGQAISRDMQLLRTPGTLDGGGLCCRPSPYLALCLPSATPQHLSPLTLTPTLPPTSSPTFPNIITGLCRASRLPLVEYTVHINALTSIYSKTLKAQEAKM